MMAEIRLQAWLDGELSAEEADRVREALAESPELQAELDALLQLDAHVLAAKEEGLEPPAVRPPWLRRAPRPVLGLALAAGFGALAVGGPWLRARLAPDPVGAYLASVDTRLVAVRTSHAATDTYRPYAPFLGPDVRTRTPPAAVLAALEEDGDQRGLAALYLLSGRVEVAAHYIAASPVSAADLSDRGALLYLQGDYAQALTVLDAAVAKDEGHAQAWWNRGLTLEALGRGAAARAAYARSAALSTPAWKAAAERRIAALEE